MDILKLVEDMKIDEKCSLLSGLDFWQTKAVERLQIPQIMVSDGPHGLRTQKIDENSKLITLEATCFPSASALGCSWDTDLCYEVGKAMGEEALDFGVSI
ncbi:MAG: glycoside hydrolase family 3 N-terminal domain-containing protein, partial [Oscillospiraceae bacterium]